MPLQEEMEKQGLWLFRYRGVLPVIIFAVGFFLYIRTKIDPSLFRLEETAYENSYLYFCLFVSLLGLAIRMYTVGYTPRNTSGRNTHGQVADSLNTTGIYSTVRHPLYLGNFFMWLGPAMLTGHFWFVMAFIFLYYIYYERIMFAEEQYLRKKFGSAYIEWAKDVPAFIPAVKNFRRSSLPFSWKKVIKNEKTGILLTFLIFTALYFIGQFIQDKTDFGFFLLGCTILALLYYIVAKILSKRTCILDEEGR